jgi:hypothetical protein
MTFRENVCEKLVHIMWTNSAHTHIFLKPQVSTVFKNYNDFNLFTNSCLFYVSLFGVKFPGDDLKKIETCRSISELYVKVYF